MTKTRIISFRSDTEVDYALKELSKIMYELSGIEINESIEIRSAILWWYEEQKNQLEMLKKDKDFKSYKLDTS